MSWNSYGARCPICWNEMTVYEDYKPYPVCACECYKCGFATSIEQYRMDLETINERREEQGEAEMTEEDYNKFKAEDFDIANM